MNNLPAIDIFFIFLILLLAVHGYVKGFVEELFSWAAPILSIWAAVFLFKSGAVFIRERYMHNVRLVPEILAFIAIFVLLMLFIKLLGRILRDVIVGVNLGFLNKLLGIIFGLIEGIAFTALILFVLGVQPFFDASKLTGESILARFLLPLILKTPLNRERDVINTVLLALPKFTA
jgi:membrane protein required for colicin V production